MKIAFDVMKFKKGQWINVVKHHERLGQHKRPASQLSQDQWLAPKPMYTLRKCDWKKLEAADAQVGTKVDGVTVRSNAVAVVGLHFQLGHSSLWRDENGKPLPAGKRPNMKKLAEQAVLEAEKIYGSGNVVGAALHCDEVSPHVEVYIVPMRDGRLNAKSFIDGPGELSDKWIGIYQGYKAAGFDVEHPDTGAGLGGADLDGLAGIAGILRSPTAIVKNEVLKYQLAKAGTENDRLKKLVVKRSVTVRELANENKRLNHTQAALADENKGLLAQLAAHAVSSFDTAKQAFVDAASDIGKALAKIVSLETHIQKLERLRVSAFEDGRNFERKHGAKKQSPAVDLGSDFDSGLGR